MDTLIIYLIERFFGQTILAFIFLVIPILIFLFIKFLTKKHRLTNNKDNKSPNGSQWIIIVITLLRLYSEFNLYRLTNTLNSEGEQFYPYTTEELITNFIAILIPALACWYIFRPRKKNL